jgi:hypothetical protein
VACVTNISWRPRGRDRVIAEHTGAQPLNDERRTRLKPLIENGLRRFTYQYDFGDNWEHVIKVEDLVLPKSGAPAIVCLAGANA